MTHSFHWSRLAEIDEAAPVEPVSFPTRSEVVALRRNLKRLRSLLTTPLGFAAPALKPRGKGDSP
ncbi:hypothetical protein ACG04Q_22615 [Roseateles sp. DXS20W]|uniref:Uncharacterized protein n=1 Tax=Pelomonas lactea TaxID=3299030 RepID=A0ABW7GQY9_9BURK